MKTLAIALFVSALLVAGCDTATSPQGGDYRIGERVRPLPETVRIPPDGYRKIVWEDLMSPGWKPQDVLKGMDVGKFQDSDPKANALLQEIRKQWEVAPVNPAMDGVAIRLPGFMAPLETAEGKIGEFLLVPFFGGCIHTPPPPANQIIHVFPVQPVPRAMARTPVWIKGVLETVPAVTGLGRAGYRMRGALVEAYDPAAEPVAP